jgi:hypothetical protein
MKLTLLIILLAHDFCGYAQLTARDTSWYVELKDSTILYSKKLSVRNSLKEGEYLLLDYNKKIPMTGVIRYKSRTGEYVRQKGPVETYRLENGGPRLFVYSRSFTYSDSTGLREGHDYFFRKGSMGELQELNYKNLRDAIADNAASMHKLQAGRSTLTIGIVGTVASAFITLAGVLTSYKSASPLVVAGPVLFVASTAVMFTAAGHMDKAINIYNQ